MDPTFERTVLQLAQAAELQELSTQDLKAKFIVKELEKAHKHDWACMCEPVSKFVQCFGVSKRPDQYMRFTCGQDRFRVWRLNEFHSNLNI
jgi:hypothetical protein